MESNSRKSTGMECVARRRKPEPARRKRHALPALFVLTILLSVIPDWVGLAQSPRSESSLPEAPQPQIPTHAAAPAVVPCPATNAARPAPSAGTAPVAKNAQGTNGQPDAQAVAGTQPPLCPPRPAINWYERFTNGPQVKPLTPKEKGWLAVRNLVDPFNAVTIMGSSAISVGSDANSPYGPGMKGFARNVGVSYTEDLTGEFVGTFLICSLAHQDPHYHRMPNASIPRRALHAIAQIGWTQADSGKGMVNYAGLAGSAIDGEIANLYVPGEKTDASSTVERYATGLATAPIDNFITEFLPDVARRIHIHVVLIQQIINQVAKTGPPGSS